MNISELTKRAIQKISKQGETITPLLFFDTFCREARIHKVSVEDCELIKNYIEKLDPEFRKEAQRHNIRNIREFLSYLTSSLNRLNQNHLAKRHNSLLHLVNKIIDAVSLIDNKELEHLAGRTDALLNRSHTAENLDEMAREWGRFAFEYKRDKNREKLSKFVPIEPQDDLDSLIDKIVPLLEREKDLRDTTKLVDLVMKSAIPSLVSFDDREFKSFQKELEEEPDKIYQPEIQEKIDKFHDRRIELDRREEEIAINEAKQAIDTLVDEVEKSKTREDISNQIEELRKEIHEVREGNGDSSEILEKIDSSLNSIAEQTSGLFSSLKKYSKGIFDIKSKIENIENSIDEKRAIADRDYLTNMKNRRGFKKDLEAIEIEYQEKKQENYSVVMIEVDEFSEIRKTYGNDAGDLILRYFAKVLKGYISVGDSTARYGDGIFLVSLPNRNLKEALEFVHKFKDKVEHTKFVYKSEKVLVTFSAGVTDRKGVESYIEIVDRCYNMLKEAKKEGRNSIYPDLHKG